MEVDPRDARYPFLSTARRTVGELDVAPAELAAADAPAVERGVERVERALLSGTVAAAEPGRWRPRDELLSYPVARVLVSLLDAPAAVEKYAAAEAATARERFVADLAEDGPRRDARIDLDALLAEFDLAGAVERLDRDRFLIDVGPYLRLSDPDWGDRFRLVNRELADGRLPVAEAECHRLLEAAVRERVAAGLPFAVGGEAGDALADALAEEVAGLRRLLADRIPRPDVSGVRPDRFPPCVRALVTRARDGEDLPPRSLVALLAFLAELGCDRDRMAALAGLDPDAVEFPATVLSDDGTAQYPPPSCATMQAQGDCVNMDDRCETIAHPLGYYESAVRDARAEDGAENRNEVDGGSADGADEADGSDRPVRDEADGADESEDGVADPTLSPGEEDPGAGT